MTAQMRLHKHAELVEAIHNVISPWVSGHDIARAALDALLEAAVRLEVGVGGIDLSGLGSRRWRNLLDGETPDTLILRLEARTDDA